MGTLPAHSFPGVGVAGRDNTPKSSILVGEPDGPEEFVPYLGRSVGTFLDPCDHLRLPKDSGTTWLMHHVPRDQRGYYRPHDLPEAYLAANPGLGERVDQYGYVMCGSNTNAGHPCQRRAANLSGHCIAHGGKLHPLDKVQSELRTAAAIDSGNTATVELLQAAHRRANGRSNAALMRAGADPSKVVDRMTRFQKLLSGLITVDDLDDEELARGMCRDSNGGFSGNPPRNVPKQLKDAMLKRVFERVDEELKNGIIDCAKTMVQIANSEVYEAADRIKAATWVMERMMGKTPDVVVHAQEKPWEIALTQVTGGSRAASRVARGVADEEEIWEVEAELVTEGSSDSGTVVGADRGTDLDSNADGGEDSLVDLDDPVENPLAGLEHEPDPIDTPTYQASEVTPALDPYDRNNEIFRDELEREAKQKLAKELKAKRRKHQRQRIIARERGFNTLQPTPFVVKQIQNEDGTTTHLFRKKRVSTPTRRLG